MGGATECPAPECLSKRPPSAPVPCAPPPEVWDREEEICDERFGVAEIKEISKDEVGTVTAAVYEGQQVEWSLEESQELLDEVSAESTREDSIEENGEPGMDDEKEVPEEPPEDENKNGGIRSDAESIVA